ncbi:hypothetical protein Tco_0466238 [Tanacetum coccineum]
MWRLFDPTPSDSLDLDVANMERTRMRLFQFSVRDQASNWLELLPAGSISTWEDLTTFPHHGIDLWLQVQIFYDHVNPVTRQTIDQSADDKLRDKNAKESWALLEDLALYDNASWNDPRDFAKPAKAISLPQDVPSTSDRRLIELKNQVQRLMEAHLAPKQLVQLNKITSLCEICSGPHDTQRLKAHVNAASTDQIEKKELRSKGIKIPSKLLSLKYLSQAFLEETNWNPSSPKHIHFVNSVIILRKEDKVREEENVKPNATEYNDHEMIAKAKEKVEEETEDEFEEEIEEG